MLETARTSRTKDVIHPQERISYNNTMIGLQARLLIGQIAINPQEILTFSEGELIQQLEKSAQSLPNTYILLEAASTNERAKYWAEKEKKEGKKTFDEQKEEWSRQLLETYNNSSNNQHKVVLAKLRIGVGSQAIDLNNFADKEAVKLYDRYFRMSPGDKLITLQDGSTRCIPSQIALFIKDISTNYIDRRTGEDGGETVTVQRDRLEQDLSSIQWFAHIFGDEYSNELVAQLIDAELKIQQPESKDKLVHDVLNKETRAEGQTTRLNGLQSREKNLLQILWSYKKDDHINNENNGTVETDNGPGETESLEQRLNRQQTSTQGNESEPIFQPVYTSEFTKPVVESLRRCGIKTEYVNPTKMGEGANHLVYWYVEPNKPPRVVKIGKPTSITTMTEGPEEEKKNFEISAKNFPGYVTNTEVFVDPQNNQFYCVVQDAVKGRYINNKMVRDNPDIKRQLGEIIRYNNDLYKREKMSLDFVGMPGFFSWLNRQKMKLLQRKSEFEVSNILVDEEGKLKIVDYEYFAPHDQDNFRKRFKGFFGLLINRILMRHYFGLDIKR